MVHIANPPPVPGFGPDFNEQHTAVAAWQRDAILAIMNGLPVDESDATPGKLMEVGSGGLLGDGINTPSNNCDLIAVSGIFNIGAVTAGTPAGSGPSGSVLFAQVFNGDNQVQTLIERGSSPNEFTTYRRQKRAGVFGLWRKETAERGFNANGSFVRLPDGTLLCNHAMLCDFSSAAYLSADWTYPAAFFSRPMVVCSILDARDATAPAGANWQGSPTVNIAPRNTSATTCLAYATRDGQWAEADKVAVNLFATGRWR